MPAHVSGKIEDGDEIIQINYQMVVGWHYKRVLQQLQESPPDVLLTLKKRPKHTKIYGQIYMKPYRLPSKKRSMPYRLGLSENLPSPRIDLIPQQNFSMLLPLPEKANLSDSDSSSSSIILPVEPTSKSTEKDLRLYLPKPRAVLQRRNTICGGDRMFGYRGNVVFWQEFNSRIDQDSPSLRDKSVSFGFGLEMSLSRPTTCIGIHNVGGDKNGELASALKGSLPDMKHVKNGRAAQNADDTLNGTADQIESNVGDDAQPKQMKNKNVKFDTNDVLVNATDSIPYADADDVEEMGETPEPLPRTVTTSPTIVQIHTQPVSPKLKQSCDETELAEAVNETLIRTHKRNAIDDPPDADKPPEIGPRREFLMKKAPPIPPPRASKAAQFLQRKLDSLKQERMSANSMSGMEKVHAALIHMDEPKPPARVDVVIETKHVEPIQAPVKPKVLPPPPIPTVLPDVLPAEPTPTLSQRKISVAKPCPDEPFEGLELLTPHKTKTLTLKKKNSILAKRRKIALKSLEVSDIQGHLFRRTKDKHGVTYWAKLYFVLVDTTLYGFRDKKSTKAHCLIFLSGFTVSLAKEVHSKPFAYKVYHPKKSFYFAAETQKALAQWMEYIKQATLKGSANSLDPMLDTDAKELFSETESSDDDEDSEMADDVSSISSSSLFKSSLTSSSKSAGSKKRDEASTSATSATVKHEKYHLGFGSLKKFTKHSLPFTSSKSDKEREEKKKNANSDIPVPTAQFRSYRKIPGNAGMQLGTNSMSPNDLIALQKPMATSSPLATPPTNHVIESSVRKNSFSPNLSPLQQQPTHHFESPTNTFLHRQMESFGRPSMSRLAKNKTLPYNYMHASNPNLVEFTFQTSKTLDYSLPKVNPSMSFDAHHNLQGFITLKDLMLQREEAEAHNMYDNRVNLGVEKQTDRQPKRKKSRSSNNDPASPGPVPPVADVDENTVTNNSNILIVKKIQSRCLPKTPDYAQSFKADDSEIIMARSKEIQKLRDFGYEFISGDDPAAGAAATAQSARLLAHSSNAKNNNNERPVLTSKRKGLNWMNIATDNRKIEDERIIVNKGSFKILRNKSIAEPPEATIKLTKNDKSLPTKQPANQESSGFYAQGANKSSRTTPFVALESTGYKLERSQSAATHDHFDSSSTSHQNGSEERKTSVDRSASYFAKLSFPTNKTAKEKRLLGSPRLHRAIFGRKNDQIVDHEAFAPLEFGSHRPSISNNANGPITLKSTAVEAKPTQPNTIETNESNIEYPPVFEPETYSLCDPSTSLTLMRRRTFNNKQ